MTYNELIETISGTCLNHYFVESFGVGKLTDINMGEDSPSVKYPHLFLIPTNLTSTKQSSTFNFQLVAMTKTYETETDNITAQSEMTTILHEIVSILDNYNNDFVLSENFTITPFSESYKDVVVGATLSTSIKFKYPFDKCNAPSTGAPSAPTTCPQVLVIDGDETDHYVDAGGTYTCLPATPKSGIFYQRQLPWENNDPGVVGSVYFHIQNGTYNYTPPTNPETIAMLKNGYENNDAGALLTRPNIYGNYYRFTNDRGQQYTEGFGNDPANTSSNPRYCIDHFNGLGWYVEQAYTERLYRTYPDAIAYANTFDYNGLDRWRVADVGEYLNSVNYNDYTNAYGGTYAPFIDPNIRNYGAGLWYGSYTKDNQIGYCKTNGGTISLTTNFAQEIDHILLVRNHFIS